MRDFVRERVDEMFASGKMLCAETVLGLIAELGGEDPKQYVRLATGFCSGVSRTCGQCGAVSGAIMGIGLFAGRHSSADEVDPAYHLVQEFLHRFRKRYGTINCLELTGCDFASPEGQARFKEEGLIDQCRDYAAFAVATSLELLGDEGWIEDRLAMVNARLGPCGLSCGHCLAFAGGRIQRLSRELGTALGDNFGVYAERFVAMNPVFARYAAFRELLDFLGEGSCGGCRKQGCLFKDCRVTACVKEHKVDYCFECTEFPCEKHGMPEGLAERWRSNNETMKEIGVEAWYAGCNARPRYP